MAYYENSRKLLDGDLILYQRNLKTAVPKAKSHRAPTWYMKLRISPKLIINRSTGRTIYEEAYSYARAEYDRLRNASALGHSLKDYTFSDHWDDWHQRNVNLGTWMPARQRWHRVIAARYFKEYFQHADGSSMRLNEINAVFANGYWNWRISYWGTGPGAKLLGYNPKRRGAKTTTTKNAAKVPSKKTLQMEQTALNQIFGDARAQGRLQQEFRLKAPADKRPHVRRPHFEETEQRELYRYLNFYKMLQGPFKNDRVNANHKLQRQQLYHLVRFLLNSGLRVGEAREMRWRDIQFDQEHGGTIKEICTVHVRKNTKTSQNRLVQTQSGANETLKEWKLLSPFSGPDDYVWFGHRGKDGKQRPLGDVNKTFQTFLKRVPVVGQTDGLLFNSEGEKRCLYSLRHTYATLRRSHGVSWEDLALNMGCKRDQLEKHYDHSTAITRRDDIIKVRDKKKKQPKPSSAPAPRDPAIAEAVKLHKAGQIDDAALAALVSAAYST